ncbi:uncharacterized protein DS421_19g641990 [Arachis hypogaea]|uniref:Uncharacterized protein n=1 Tax=Arachis hypogaea TaxID=3818 RepID=A0A6B9V6B2_ARAHY|nr:uncharacterized protein DS421_19g641990 [Arachis hypogaea]
MQAQLPFVLFSPALHRTFWTKTCPSCRVITAFSPCAAATTDHASEAIIRPLLPCMAPRVPNEDAAGSLPHSTVATKGSHHIRYLSF